MATYIKIRELNPYPTSTGIFSGDMLASALDTVTAGTPHSVAATQRAPVSQIIESYNIQAAEQQGSDQGLTKAQVAATGTVLPNGTLTVTTTSGAPSACVLSSNPGLTLRNLDAVVKRGGGLAYSPQLVSTGSDGCETYSYELSLATQSPYNSFYLHFSGGAGGSHSIQANGHVQGKFPNLKSGWDWANENINAACDLYFLIETNLLNTQVDYGYYSMTSPHVENFYILDYGLWKWKEDINANGGGEYSETTTYSINNIVQYKGLTAGTVGNYNYYQSQSDSNLGNIPDVSAGWEQFVPSDATGQGDVGTNTTRPYITINPLNVLTPPTGPDEVNSIFRFSHNGNTEICGVKFLFNNCNLQSEDKFNYYYNFSKEKNYKFTISQSEVHLYGGYLMAPFRISDHASLSITDYNSAGIPSNAPDPYGVTGAAGQNVPIAALYLNASGLYHL